jgi:hypothetical protein
MRTIKMLIAATLVFAGGVAAAGCSASPATEDEHVSTADQALTAAQCDYFDVNGKVTICHKTASVKNPYTVLKISEQACISAHASHAGDYVAVNDPTCQGGGCLPQGAPCDATLPCCSGSTCTGGVCVQNCVPTTCEAQGAVCGTIPDGCGDTLDCGGCGPGYGCQANQCVDVDECLTDGICDVNATCTNLPGTFTCTCNAGYTGDGVTCNPTGPTCPCATLDAWKEEALANSYDYCADSPGNFYLRGTAQYYYPNGNALRTGLFSQGVTSDPFGGSGSVPSQCGAVSVTYGLQTIENITDDEVAACGTIIKAVGGTRCP